LSCNKVATAKFNSPYELKNRIYLGPTSTDNDLAFMMCNQALIGEGSLVIDPFVGTGGLLIPPASKGAITFGSDLDIRVINGYSVGRINKRSPYYSAEKKFEVFTPKINLSFEQYGFPIPNIIRVDCTKMVLHSREFFDAIITDPPYGIRAMSRTVTARKQE
jgi:tRNA (guanine10-N2)-methyltransferase